VLLTSEKGKDGMENKVDLKSIVKALMAIEDETIREETRKTLELNLGMKLKVDTSTVAIRKLAKRMLPPEYSVVALHICMTCGTVSEQYFRMTQDEVRFALISVPLTEKPQHPYKEIKSHHERCMYCEEVLRGLTKDDLINKIFGTIERLKKLA